MTTIHLDVRPMLADGQEPFSVIMETAAQVVPGGTLELLAPFEPQPLFRVMRQQGFGYVAEPVGDAWRVRFRQLGIRPESPLRDVHDRYPATAGVLGAIGADLCCGGDLPLSQVAEAHGVPLDQLLADLQDAALAAEGAIRTP